MDRATIDQQLAEYNARLAQMEDERNALVDVVKGLVALRKAIGPPDHGSPEPIAFPGLPTAVKTGTKPPPDRPSMRGSVRRALEESGGEPLHSREILARAQELGGSTNSKSPTSVVDLIVLDLANRKLVKKIAPRTWRWVGNQKG